MVSCFEQELCVVLEKIITMGNLRSPAEQAPVPETDQAVSRASTQLIEHLERPTAPEPRDCHMLLRILNRRLVGEPPVRQDTEGKLVISPIVIQWWFSKGMDGLLPKLFGHWMDLLEGITCKNILFVSLQQWQYLSELCQFIMTLSMGKLYYTMNNITVLRCSLAASTAELVSSHLDEAEGFEEQDKQPFMDHLRKDQAEKIYKCLLLIVCQFIRLETSTISRSRNTLQAMENFAERCFVLFMRIYFNPAYYEELRRRAVKVNNEANLQNASYFLGRAISNKNTALYNIAVLFLVSLVIDNKTNPHVSSLPSHLFQQLPTQTSTNIYEFILTNVLLSLAYEKTAEGRYDKKLNCDRFYSYRLVLLLLSNGQARFGRLSTFYLENICRHTKLEQVERVYLHELATEAIQAEQSDFLSKYAMSSAANYQVTFTNRKVVLTPKELKDYLDPIADLLCEEMDLYFQAYVTTTFMKQPQATRDDDKALWERVLARRKEHIRMTNGNF